ncbi:MAG: hypothetical protein QOG25_1028, partial [Acetobacteraceae bacterium]|nr:hypothetical protein [Acetobacteraceae bacterium]
IGNNLFLAEHTAEVAAGSERDNQRGQQQ